MNIVNEQFEDLKYAINYPNCYKEGEKFPVIIYLHGAGTRGDDMNVLINNACFQETDEDGFKALSYVYSDTGNDDLYSFLYKNSAYALGGYKEEVVQTQDDIVLISYTKQGETIPRYFIGASSVDDSVAIVVMIPSEETIKELEKQTSLN